MEVIPWDGLLKSGICFETAMSYSGLTGMAEVNVVKIHIVYMKAMPSLKSGQKLAICLYKKHSTYLKLLTPPKNPKLSNRNKGVNK